MLGKLKVRKIFVLYYAYINNFIVENSDRRCDENLIADY